MNIEKRPRAATVPFGGVISFHYLVRSLVGT